MQRDAGTHDNRGKHSVSRQTLVLTERHCFQIQIRSS